MNLIWHQLLSLCYRKETNLLLQTESTHNFIEVLVMKIKDLNLEKLFSTYYNWILGKASLFPIDVVILLEVSVKNPSGNHS